MPCKSQVIWVGFFNFSEFSESLRELGMCLLEKTALHDDDENGEVIAMCRLTCTIDNKLKIGSLKVISLPRHLLLASASLQVEFC